MVSKDLVDLWKDLMHNYITHLFVQYQMKSINTIAYKLSKYQSMNVDRYFTDIKKLKRTLQKEHFFVRKHHKEFGAEIQRCIMSRQWDILKEGLKCINFGQLDSWLTLRKIAKTFSQVINSISIKKMRDSELQNLLYCLNALNYEIVSRENQSVKNNYPYDDIDSFIGELRKHVEDLHFLRTRDHYLLIFKELLHTNPQLFQPNRSKVEKYLLNNLDELCSRSKYFLTEIISKGCISNYWSDQFEHKMTQKVKAKQLNHVVQSLYFQNLAFPNQITQSNLNNKIKTEDQIINILQGYGYNIKQSLDINKYEIDVLINDFLIVEYNGHHHYVINSDQLVPTLKHRWKNQILKKRGFLVSSISYPEWKGIHLFEQKRKFLVNKIETDLLNYYSL